MPSRNEPLRSPDGERNFDFTLDPDELASAEFAREALAVASDAFGEDVPFGAYQLVRQIGRGGMGIVYEARSLQIESTVALKIMRGADSASEAEIRRFLFEAEAQANLRHDNIVRVYHCDQFQGYPFFTMPLMKGGSLADVIAQQRGPLCEAAEFRAMAKLMVSVADAVYAAHNHGLLHRDIKPGNVLLDERGKPHIADFGLARPLSDADGAGCPSGAGTDAYMSPEQAAGSANRFTVSSDIYSLGAVLYQLITRRTPFEGSSGDLRARITSDEPITPPSAFARAIPTDLERVTLKCLAKDPNRRYASAQALARDLNAVAEGKAPAVGPLSRWGRTVHWARRNPRLLSRVAWTLLFFTSLFTSAFVLWQRSVAASRSVLDTNAFIASSQAGAALFQLREYADRLAAAAQQPWASRIATTTLEEPPPAELIALAKNFDTVVALDRQGRVTAQWPPPRKDLWDYDYRFRDYFRGACKLGESNLRTQYVARAVSAESDGELKFALSTPLYQGGTWNGVLVFLLATSSVFGNVPMQDSSASERISALLGPRDVDRNEPEEWRARRRFVYLAHDNLRRGQEVPVPALTAAHAAFVTPAEPGQQFVLRSVPPSFDSDYHDPVPGHDGLWHAAFAPVGATGYVVVVQTRRDSFEQRVSAFLRGTCHLWGCEDESGAEPRLSL